MNATSNCPQEQPVRWAEWVTTVLGMLWLAVFPLWQGGSYASITHAKWVGMLMLTTLTAVACLYTLQKRFARRQESGLAPAGLRLSWLHVAALCYFVLVALSARFGSWADHCGESGRLTVIWGARRYEGLITQGCYGVIFLCLSLTRVRLRYLLDAAAIVLLLYFGGVMLQYRGVNFLDMFPTGRSIQTNYEFQGTIGNIDMVVGYVSLVMPLLLTGFALMKHPGWLWLLSGLAGVMLMLMMEVQSGLIATAAMLFALCLAALRAPDTRWRVLLILGGSLVMLSVRLLLGLPWLDGAEELTFPLPLTARRLLPAMAGLMLISLAPVLRRWKGPAVPTAQTVFIALTALLILVLLLYMLPSPQGSGLWEMQEILHGRPRDMYGSERIGVWRLTLEMAQENLLWGTGPDAFLYALDHHMYETGQRLVQTFDTPHNLLLGVLINSGLPAAALFVTLCGGALVRALHRAGQDHTVLPLMMAAGCYLLQGMFTFSICLVTPMFWAVLGMLAGQTARDA